MRSDGSAFPPYPADSDHHSINRIFHREYADEAILTPQTDEQVRAYEDAYAELTAGEVIQPHCRCGAFSTIGECAKCQRDLDELEQMIREDEREIRERRAWRRKSA